MRSSALSGLLIILSMLVGQFSWAEDKQASLLERHRIKYLRDERGAIVSVELPPFSTEAAIEVLPKVPSIRVVRAPKCRALPDALERLADLPNLTDLHLDGAKDANDYVAAIEGVGTLKVFSLAESNLTNHGLDQLCDSHPRLRKLDISSTYVQPVRAISVLLKLHDLESLQLRNINRQDFVAPDSPLVEEFAELANLPRLRILSASGFNISTSQILPFADLPRLQDLYVENIRIDSRHLARLHESFLGAEIQVPSPHTLHITRLNKPGRGGPK